MRSLLAIAGVVVLVGAVAVLALGPAHAGTAGRNSPRTTIGSSSQATVEIDGAEDPSRIPDAVAYRMLFRVISHASMDEDPSAVQSYIRQMGLGRPVCESCEGTVDRDGEEAAIASLIELAREFRQKIAIIDDQASATLRAGVSTGALAAFRVENERLVNHTIAALPDRIGPEAAEAVDLFVQTHLKRGIRMTITGQR